MIVSAAAAPKNVVAAAAIANPRQQPISAVAIAAAAPGTGDAATDAGAPGCANVATAAAPAIREGGGTATGAGAPGCGHAPGAAAALRGGDVVAGADAPEGRDAIARAGRP